MKVLTILRSPKKKGKTAAALMMFEEEMKSRGNEVERINITEYNINGCLGCGVCTGVLDNPGCVQKDDFSIIFDKMTQSDVIVYASPLTGWDISSQIKPLMDRHFCLVKGYSTENHKSLIENKQISLLITCGGPIEKNADIVQVFFDRFGSYAKGKVFGKYIVPFSQSSGFENRAKNTAEKMAGALDGYHKAPQ